MQAWFSQLKQELMTDPEQLGYASMSDAQAAETLNQKRYKVPKGELWTATGVIECVGIEVMDRVLGVFNSVAENSPAIKSQLDKFYTTGIDLSHPMVSEFLYSLVNAGLLSADDVDVVISCGFKNLSRAEMILGEGVVVSEQDVRAARDYNPTITYQILLSISHDSNNTSATLMVNQLIDGRPVGERNMYLWRRGEELPSGNQYQNALAQCIQSILQLPTS